MAITSEIDCFHSKSSTISRIGKDDPRIAIALLVVLINDLADTFNIGKNMGALQVMETAQLVYNEFPDFKVDDFALCFNKAKTGHYGKIYDRLDCPVICGWLNRYEADKSEQIEHYWINERKKESLLVGPVLPMADDETAKRHIKAISDTISKIKKQVKLVYKDPEPKPINHIQQLHQNWILRFQQIWGEGSKPSGKQFIQRYGRMIDINEYLERKQYQYNLWLIRSQ